MKLDSGKLVIIAILATAVAAAGFAWWYQYEHGRRALAYWGAEGALLIRTAPQVELVQLARPVSQTGPGGLTLDEGSTLERRDVSAARGIVHARQALISDPSYVWDDRTPAAPAWQYALRFRKPDQNQEAVLWLDLDQGWIQSARHDAPVRMGPTLKQGLRTFFAEQLEHRNEVSDPPGPADGG